jgi:hypothetical protein
MKRQLLRILARISTTRPAPAHSTISPPGKRACTFPPDASWKLSGAPFLKSPISDGCKRNSIKAKSCTVAPDRIYVLKGQLVIGTNGDSYLEVLDLAAKRLPPLANPGAGTIDGIAPYRDSDLLASHNERRPFCVSVDARVTKNLNMKDQPMNMADFAYDPGRSMIVFPTFIDRCVAAYRPAGESLDLSRGGLLWRRI